MADPAWKKAQTKVKSALKAFEDTRKDFWLQEPVDTYQAGNFVKEQPADLWFLHGGLFSLLEVKSSHYEEKFYFKDVQNSQWIGVRRVAAAGGMSAFILAKLPQWHWYLVKGMDFYQHKEAGNPGMLWSEMRPIKLDAQIILRLMYEWHGLEPKGGITW